MGRVFSYLKRKDIYRPDLSFRNGSTSPPFPSTHLTNNIKYKGKRTNGWRKDHLFRRQIASIIVLSMPSFHFLFLISLGLYELGEKGNDRMTSLRNPRMAMPWSRVVVYITAIGWHGRNKKKRDRHIPLSLSGTRPSCDRLTNTWTEADPPSPGTHAHGHTDTDGKKKKIGIRFQGKDVIDVRFKTLIITKCVKSWLQKSQLAEHRNSERVRPTKTSTTRPSNVNFGRFRQFRHTPKAISIDVNQWRPASNLLEAARIYDG